MAKGDATDLMMKFIDDSGQHINGECTTEPTSSEANNQLLTGFKLPHIFEIDRFNFSAGRKDAETDKTGKLTGGVNYLNGPHTIAPPHATQPKKGGKVGFPGDLQPISFTRSIDVSSAGLLQSCIDCRSYKRASLIKRKAAGTLAAGEVFLRLDFIGVLIISVQWSNDDEVQETCEFICRSVCINYRPQLPDGTLGKIVPGFWSMVPTERQQPPLE